MAIGCGRFLRDRDSVMDKSADDFDFEFTESIIPHSSLSVEELEDFDYLLAGCGCQTDCSEAEQSTCGCRKISECAYTSDHLLRDEYLLSSSHPPIIECGQTCSCPPSCQSRLLSRFLSGYFCDQEATECKSRAMGFTNRTILADVFRADGKGMGIRTLRPIKRGEFVSVYAGEVISAEEAQKRENLFTDTYIFAVKESSSAFEQRTFIDARSIGDHARFINHSCDPNLVMIPVRVDIVVPHLALFARREIQAHEELTVDYGQGDSDTVSSSTRCLCGAKNCRGFLPRSISD